MAKLFKLMANIPYKNGTLFDADGRAVEVAVGGQISVPFDTYRKMCQDVRNPADAFTVLEKYEKMAEAVLENALAAPEPPEAGTDADPNVDDSLPDGLQYEVVNLFGKFAGYALVEAGYPTLTSMRSASDDHLRAITNVGPKTLKAIRSFIPAPEGAAESDEGDAEAPEAEDGSGEGE